MRRRDARRRQRQRAGPVSERREPRCSIPRSRWCIEAAPDPRRTKHRRCRDRLQRNRRRRTIPSRSRSIVTNADHCGCITPPGVTRCLLVEGWAISRAGIERVEVEVDGRPVGDANYGLRASRSPERNPACRSASALASNDRSRISPADSHEVRVIATNRAGDAKEVTVTWRRPLRQRLGSNSTGRRRGTAS